MLFNSKNVGPALPLMDAHLERRTSLKYIPKKNSLGMEITVVSTTICHSGLVVVRGGSCGWGLCHIGGYLVEAPGRGR